MAGRIEEADPRERHRTRVVHRTGVFLFVLVLAAALVGLIGNGPLSKSSAQTPDGTLKVENRRFIHYQAPADLRIQVAAKATANGSIRLELSKQFVDENEIERIEPEPESSIAGAKYFTHMIRVETNAATQVKVRFAASHFGRLAYEVGLGDGPRLQVWHFAFP